MKNQWTRGTLPEQFKGLHGDDLDLALAIANGVYRSGEDESEAIDTAITKLEEHNMDDTAPNEGKEHEIIDEGVSFSVSLTEAVAGDDDIVMAPATLIEAGWSKNDRYYSPELLAGSAGRYEGAGSFDGHLANPTPTDYTGVYEGVIFDRSVGALGALTSTYKIFDEKLGKVARHAPHLIGLSINDKARVKRGTIAGRTGWIVEEFKNVRPSCDCVVNAGARGGIGAVLEAFNKEDQVEITSIKDLKEAYPELTDNMAENAKAAALNEVDKMGQETELKESLDEAQKELQTVSGERDEALAKVAILESRAVLDEKLAEVDLPVRIVARIREQFAAIVAEPDAVDKAIKDYKELIVGLKEDVNVSGVVDDPEDTQDQTNSDLKLLEETGFLGGE